MLERKKQHLLWFLSKNNWFQITIFVVDNVSVSISIIPKQRMFWCLLILFTIFYVPLKLLNIYRTMCTLSHLFYLLHHFTITYLGKLFVFIILMTRSNGSDNDCVIQNSWQRHFNSWCLREWRQSILCDILKSYSQTRNDAKNRIITLCFVLPCNRIVFQTRLEN